MEKWNMVPLYSVYHEYKRFGAFQITKQDIVKEYFGNIENNSLGNIKYLSINHKIFQNLMLIC